MFRRLERVVRVVVGIAVLAPGADLALLLGCERGSHHWSCVAAIIMGHNGGRSRLLISKKMNPPIYVVSKETTHLPQCVHHKCRLQLHWTQV